MAKSLKKPSSRAGPKQKHKQKTKKNNQKTAKHPKKAKTHFHGKESQKQNPLKEQDPNRNISKRLRETTKRQPNTRRKRRPIFMAKSLKNKTL